MSSPTAQKHDETTIEGILKVHQPALRRFFLRRIRSDSDVDDLVQDVFFRLVRRGNISSVLHVQAYLFQTANSVLHDYLRATLSRQHDNHDNSVEDDVASPERILLGKEAVDEFARALMELPERTRVIFVLSRLNEIDYRTIARLQGISISAVEKHIAKALVYLMEKLRI